MNSISRAGNLVAKKVSRYAVYRPEAVMLSPRIRTRRVAQGRGVAWGEKREQDRDGEHGGLPRAWDGGGEFHRR